ncbi:Hint domain-containing protein [uncultured Tateyamaria sp.]|uniref:Hint domain-containing protein n=1 Tax=Tateyamaria sp. 1078 TaxID=3417464 RepID=UPI002611A514|nr:Hint domain-containing protein [uncultured Tateyamaria sp.]
MFSWNDIFPGVPQTGTSSTPVGETFTFNGGGDLVTYRDTDTFSGQFGDHGNTNNRIFGEIDGVNVDETWVNPEYAYNIKDSNGVTVGKMYAITKNNSDLADIEAFVFDFEPIKGETYTLASTDGTPQAQYEDLYVCFAAGTLINTCQGARAAADIRPGDKVQTRENGLQEVVWVGSRTMHYQHLALHPQSRPILIAAGALGAGTPVHALVVSPQHRVLVSSKIVERMTGQSEIMVPAKKLLGIPGVEHYLPDAGVTYVHILCRTHELVVANGTFVETMYLGDESLNMLSQKDRAEIAALHPGIADQMTLHPTAQAGQTFRGKINKLVHRHGSKNRNMVQDSASHAAARPHL